jgi:hypothetical protein
MFGSTSRSLRVLAVVSVLAILTAAVGLIDTSRAAADFATALHTSVAVAPGGTLIMTMNTSGATIVSSTSLSGCSQAISQSVSVIYTCDEHGNGIPAGTVIQQSYTTSASQITETVTYNANGPRHVVPTPVVFSVVVQPCTTAAQGFSCSLTTDVETVPGNQILIYLQSTQRAPGVVSSEQFTSTPSMLGTCPIVPVQNEPLQALYRCAAGQSIPKNTVINTSASGTNLLAPPEIHAQINNLGPVGLGDLPAPMSETLTVSAPLTVMGGNVSGGPTPTAPPAATSAGGSTSAGSLASGGSSSTNAVAVTYASGWNLIARPSGAALSATDGPLFTFQATDSAYETIPASAAGTPGWGYWAFFESGGTQTIPQTGPQSLTIALPTGHWVMVGNPGSGQASVSGADVVYAYSAVSGYQAATSLGPGQGAWAISLNGGTLTIATR